MTLYPGPEWVAIPHPRRIVLRGGWCRQRGLTPRQHDVLEELWWRLGLLHVERLEPQPIP